MFGQAVTDQLTGPCLPERYVSTNAIESMIGICCEHAKNVKHWRDGKMALRWCAALVRCAGALRWCAALVRCAGALRWCAALVRCRNDQGQWTVPPRQRPFAPTRPLCRA
jgi:hypothetical protein